MKESGINAWWIPGTDPHMSEYLSEYWQERKHISGFTGSAGQVLVTETFAGLWTDSRYFLQAEEELQDSGITLFKMGTEGTPDLFTKLLSVLKEGDVLGVNPDLVSFGTIQNLDQLLAAKGVSIKTNVDCVDLAWTDRPELPSNPLVFLEDEVAGESVNGKLERFRSYLNSKSADYALITGLDEIAWLFNLRGSDIAYNPVFYSYAIIGLNEVKLFVSDAEIIPADYNLKDITVCVYTDVLNEISKLEKDASIILDGSKVSYSLTEACATNLNIIDDSSWVTLEKAKKNTTEIEGFNKAMIVDGIALVKFYMWLEHTLKKGETINEYEAGVKLAEVRAEHPDFVSESFNPIVGYMENGAIVHYSAKPDTAKQLEAQGVMLLDSGGQYKYGTTDITRTTALGIVKVETKKDYTLVLKGHLALSRAKFPAKTRGVQLDTYARHYLWQECLDYGHGTGHGVGHFLNVHEGPHTIRKEDNGIELYPGMVVSNEPGIYRSGIRGIRIENLIYVKPYDNCTENTFYTFETLTLFPYDLDLIDRTQLSRQETEQINSYHKRVYDTLAPHLEVQEKEWLRIKTRQV